MGFDGWLSQVVGSLRPPSGLKAGYRPETLLVKKRQDLEVVRLEICEELAFRLIHTGHLKNDESDDNYDDGGGADGVGC